MSILSGPIQTFNIDAHGTDDSSDLQLGAVGFDKFGNRYRWVKAGGSDLAAGKLAVAATQTANHENLTCAVASIGATAVTVTLGGTAATLNEYAEGYLVINDVTGEGTAYRISGHPAQSATTGNLTVQLADPITVALTTSSQASLVKNLYADVVISATDQADKAVGIPNVVIAAGEYGWMQVAGVCAALADEAVTAGLSLTIGTGVAGAVEAADAAGEQVIGVAHTALVDTEYRSIVLTLE
jgi:hypothetical protein